MMTDDYSVVDSLTRAGDRASIPAGSASAAVSDDDDASVSGWHSAHSAATEYDVSALTALALALAS
eukprot:1689211-Rhodomonas_salina.2